VIVVIVSRLTSKAQTTIPKPILAALELQPGDELSYEILDGRVILAKVHQHGTLLDDPFRTFEEWHSEADTAAYADL
jgi:antitoxin PrlF